MTAFRIWLLAIVLGAAASMLMLAYVVPARAQDGRCEPVETIIETLGDADIPGMTITTEDGSDFVRAYAAMMRLPIPAESDPVGALFIEIKDGPRHVLRFGIIERAGCVRFHASVNPAYHAIMYGRAKVGT